MKKTISIMDFQGIRRSVEVDTDKEIRILILSGDEVLINGDNRYDSSNDRITDYYDGEYTLDVNADWFKKWDGAKDSYVRQDIAIEHYVEDEE